MTNKEAKEKLLSVTVQMDEACKIENYMTIALVAGGNMGTIINIIAYLLERDAKSDTEKVLSDVFSRWSE